MTDLLVEACRSLLDARTRMVREAQRYGPLMQPKLELIASGCDRFKIRSLADLGAAYRVNGGYTFFAVDCCGVERAFLLDTHPTERAIEEAAKREGVKVIQGNFGDPAVAAQVGQVDAVMLFDVLLHQVAPDWDELLELYRDRTRLFLIHNPQWLGDETTRLLDLGAEQYLSVVPKTRNEENYRAALERPDEIQPTHGRRNRDVHHVWQWGITDASLIARLDSLGFSLRSFQDHGFFWGLDRFRNRSFIFEKRD